MYVCLCLGVTDRDIRRQIEDGACSVAEVMRCTGAGTRCGSCRSTIAAMTGSSDARDMRSTAADPTSPFAFVPSLV
jgi:bacterioferritin-associated ferredoxin